MPDYGMTEDEFIESLRRQLLSFVRLIERRLGRSLNVDIQVVRKDS